MAVTLPRRRVVVGLYVASEHVRALALRGEQIVWSGEVSRASFPELGSALDRVLADLRPAGLMRVAVAVGIGPGVAQVRHVEGIAATRDSRLVASVVSANVNRFFLVNGVPLCTTRPQWAPSGGAWVGAIDQPVVDHVAAACRRAGLRIVAIAPVAASLGHAIRGDEISWQDGPIRIIVRYQGAFLDSYRRTLAHDIEAVPPRELLHPALAAMSDAAVDFAPAFAIARAGPHVAMPVDPARYAPRGARGLYSAAAACATALILFVSLPALMDQRRAGHAATRLATIASSSAADQRAARELSGRIALHRDLSAFRAGARSTTLALASLTRAIEHPSMTHSIQLDTLGGTLVASTPRAGALVAMLDSIPEIHGVRIAGAVTQDARPPRPPTTAALGHAEDDNEFPMERVTIRFFWRGAAVSAAKPRATASAMP